MERLHSNPTTGLLPLFEKISERKGSAAILSTKKSVSVALEVNLMSLPCAGDGSTSGLKIG